MQTNNTKSKLPSPMKEQEKDTNFYDIVFQDGIKYSSRSIQFCKSRVFVQLYI